jgi:hypothetical protein
MSDIQAQAKRDAEFDRLLCYESDKVVYDATDMTDAYEMGKRHGREMDQEERRGSTKPPEVNL